MVEYDYNGIVNEVTQRGIRLFDNFDDWTRGAQSLSSLGEGGRSLFLAISSLSSDIYNHKENERKFTNALKTTKKVTIATFIYMCKQAGIDTTKYVIRDFQHQNSAKLVKPVYRMEEPKPTKLCFLNSDLVARSLDVSLRSNLQAAMCRMVNDTKAIRDACTLYALGVTSNGACIFWQIDTDGKVRTGKIMQYDWYGHRDKEHNQGATDWVHHRLKKLGRLPADWQLTQCLFGAHLLHPSFNNHNKVIGFVESEKTAVYCSLAFPQYVWVACGGFGQEQSSNKHMILKGRTVVMFPDAHPEGRFYKRWCEIANEWQKEGIRASVADLLEKKATIDEKERKIDIGDWIANEWRDSYVPSPIEYANEPTVQEIHLAAIMERNDCVRTLVEKLKLEMV